MPCGLDGEGRLSDILVCTGGSAPDLSSLRMPGGLQLTSRVTFVPDCLQTFARLFISRADYHMSTYERVSRCKEPSLRTRGLRRSASWGPPISVAFKQIRPTVLPCSVSSSSSLCRQSGNLYDLCVGLALGMRPSATVPTILAWWWACPLPCRAARVFDAAPGIRRDGSRSVSQAAGGKANTASEIVSSRQATHAQKHTTAVHDADADAGTGRTQPSVLCVET